MAVSDVLALTVPALLAGVGLYGALTGTDVFSALTAGALDGLKTVVRIFPALVVLLAAVSMLRASGALDALTRLCSPVLAWLGIPPETAILMVVRPGERAAGALAGGKRYYRDLWSRFPHRPHRCRHARFDRDDILRPGPCISAPAASGAAAGRSPPPSPPT